MGLVSLGLSTYWFVFFFRSPKAIGKAVAYMVGGEALATMLILAFNTLALFDMIRTASPIILAAMRLVGFTVVTVTTLHLSKAVRETTT